MIRLEKIDNIIEEIVWKREQVKMKEEFFRFAKNWEKTFFTTKKKWEEEDNRNLSDRTPYTWTYS